MEPITEIIFDICISVVPVYLIVIVDFDILSKLIVNNPFSLSKLSMLVPFNAIVYPG